MTRVLVTLALALALSGCGGPALLVRDAHEAALAPPSEGRARVVFVLPDAFRDVVSLVDDRGAYLGQLGGRTWTTLEVAPGRHRFYALVGASAHVVVGTLEAGRTYWVRAEGAFARPFSWRAGDAACDDDAMGRLASLRAVEPDPGADVRTRDRMLGDVPQRVLEADEAFAALRPAHQEARTLRPGPPCVAP